MSRIQWAALSALAIAAVAGTVLALRGPGPVGPPTPPPDDAGGPAVFEDVTARTGIAFAYHNGEEANFATILESLGGGSLEGKVVRGRPGKLYRNLGDWKFEDVSDRAGIAASTDFYTHGVAVADYDRDGFPDLVVTGWKRVALLHNEPDPEGGRRFADVSAKALPADGRWPTAAAWADFDGDGFPDLYVCHYVDWSFDNDPVCAAGGARDVCAPQKFKPLQHRLYRNAGNGTFADATATAPLRPDGKGLGAVAVDADADGKPDLYFANDGGDNFLYRNLGGFRFEEVGMAAGVATDDSGLYNGSMGVDAADFDGTGLPSLFVANFQGEINALYRNLDGKRFRHHSQAAGLGRIGRSFVGFGAAFADFDRAGWEDLVVANGHVLLRPSGSAHRQRPIYLRNEEHEGRRQFREIPGKGGEYFRNDHVGRGLAVADLDNDGWPDVVVSHQNDPVRILRNVSGVNSDRHWLRVALHGKDRRDLVGTALTLEVDGRKLTRFVKGGGSYFSANDPRIDFGLGTAARVGKLTVKWSHGGEGTYEGLAVDREHAIREGGAVLK